MQKIVARSLAAAFLFWLPSSVMALNGLNLIGYGARYAGMGGAHLAVGGSVMDLQSNPANLARLEQAQFEAGAAFGLPYMTYRDSYYDENASLAPNTTSYSNSVTSEPAVFPIPYMGYVAPIGKKMGWGIAFYGQGGLGANFKGIRRHTPALPVNAPYLFSPGTIDQVMSAQMGTSVSLPYIGGLRQVKENVYDNFSFARLTPGFAFKLGKLSIGAAVDFGVALLEWRWTFSDPSGAMELPGAGYRYKSDPAYSISGKVGVVYELTDAVSVAYAYKAPTKMYFNGDMSINADNPNYFRKMDTSMYFEWPESHRVGVAFSKSGLTLSMDVEYVKWSNVMNTLEFHLPYPWIQTPIGNYIDTMAFNLKWSDQTVIALGMEYRPNSVAYRIGYNYGKSPVGPDGMNPLFAAIAEHHATVGLGIRAGSLDIDFALEYDFPSKVKGSDMSDWDLYHAMYGASLEGAKMPNYNHSVEMYMIIPSIGVTYKF